LNSSERHHLNWLFEHITPAVAVVAGAVGVIVILGWLFDLDVLKSVLPGLTAMKVNTALGFILSGVALWGIQNGGQGKRLRLVSQLSAGVVLLLGLLTLGEYLSGMDFGIDQLLIRETTNLPGDIPGRFAVNTALSFAAAGAALLLLSLENGGLAVAIHVLIMVPIIAAGSALIGYGYDIGDFLRQKPNYTPMAIHSATVFVLLALGVVNARPDYPFRRFMTSDSAAGVTVRRLLPAVTGFTLVTGWLIQHGYHAGYFGEAMVSPLFTVASIAGLGVMILWNANMLYEASAQSGIAQEELYSASQYARSLIEASVDPLVTINLKGKITDVNEATIKATGVAREALIGSDFSEYFTEPDKARKGYQQAFAKGFVTDYPLTLQHVSGRNMEVLYNASVYRNGKGEVAGVFAAARDITGIKLAEAKVRYLAAIVESSDDAITGKTMDGIITSWNKGAERLYGYTETEAIGQPLSILLPSSHADEIPLLLEQIKAGKHVEHFETVRKRKDGNEVHVSLSLSPISTVDGKVVGAATVAREITVLKQVEEQLRSTLLYARSLIEASLDPLVTISAAGKITDVNEATVKATGVERTALTGSDFSEYFTDPDQARAGYQEAFAKGFVKDYPLSLRHNSGKVMEVLYNASVYHNEKGEVAGIFAAARDITERKLAEEQLRSASMYARSLIEANLDPLVTISSDGKITDVNEATVQATGMPRKLLIGSDFSEYFTDPEKARAGYQKVFARGFVTDYPLSLRHVSGRVKDVLYNASVYRNMKGEVSGVFASARDITEHKLTEEELRSALLYARSLIEANLDPLVTISPEGKITDVNEATVQATGLPRKLLIGSDFSNYFTDQDKARAGYQEAFSKGFITNLPLTLRHLSGKVTEVLYNASVYRNAKGDVEGVFASAHDITESKRAEEKLNKYQSHLNEMVQERTAQLEMANNELEGFAYSVSHDLRVPLRAIDGFSHLVLKHYEDKLDDEGKRHLNVIQDNTKKMGQIIDDILAFSRMGRQGMSMSEIDMDELARKVFEELKPSFAGRKLTMKIGPLPLCRGDYSMLRQVWVNLLGNAIKFTRSKDAALVEVGGHIKGKENIYYVKDNGAGFDMQYADKLFGVFQRLHGVEEFGGTGIGLAIVKRIIVTRHGGRVWAEGKVNEGATFYFALPLQEKGT